MGDVTSTGRLSGEATGADDSAPPTPTPTPTPVGRRPGPAQLVVASTLLGVVALGGALLAFEPGENAVDSWGFTVFPRVFDSPFLGAVTDIGRAAVTFGVAVVVGALVWRRDRGRAIACPVGPALAIGLAELLKVLVGRRFEGALCWPSGTAAAVAAVITMLVLVTPPTGRPMATLVGAVVMTLEVVTLVSFRWHYLSDALGGVVLGVGCALFVDAVVHRLGRPRRRRPSDLARPAI
jgi:undecaprenyl-diphosphatase